MLEVERTADNLYHLANPIAQGKVSEAIRAGLAVASLTALRKSDSEGNPTFDVRGIATGLCLRCFVARTIARQYSDIVLEHTRPFQFALSTRAGVDCDALICRAMTDADGDAVISSLDGVGAYDHVSRNAFFEQLAPIRNWRS